MRQALIVLGSLALVAALEAAYYAYRFLADRRTRELRRRLQSLGREPLLDSELLRRRRVAARPTLDRLLRSAPLVERLERLLEQADSRLTVAQLLAYSAIAAGGGLIAGSALRMGALPVIGIVALGLVLPTLVVVAARDRRSRKLSEQLPEALDMMSRSLRAGHAVSAAFQIVAGELPEPICIEFARAYEEQRLGLSLERAVLEMSARAPGNGDLNIFAVSMVIQKETGGNLAEVLQKIAETIRERYRFHGKLRALTAEGRASAIVLGVLPIGMALVLMMVNPTYMGRLFDNKLGQMILLYALTTWVVGLVWLTRMAKVDV